MRRSGHGKRTHRERLGRSRFGFRFGGYLKRGCRRMGGALRQREGRRGNGRHCVLSGSLLSLPCLNDQARKLRRRQRHQPRILGRDRHLEKCRADTIQFKNGQRRLPAAQGIFQQRRRQGQRLFGGEGSGAHDLGRKLVNHISNRERRVGWRGTGDGERGHAGGRIDRRRGNRLLARCFKKGVAADLKRRCTGGSLQCGRCLHEGMTGIHRARHARMGFREVLSTCLGRFRGTGFALEQTSERKTHQRMKRPDSAK